MILTLWLLEEKKSDFDEPARWFRYFQSIQFESDTTFVCILLFEVTKFAFIFHFIDIEIFIWCVCVCLLLCLSVSEIGKKDAFGSIQPEQHLFNRMNNRLSSTLNKTFTERRKIKKIQTHIHKTKNKLK